MATSTPTQLYRIEAQVSPLHAEALTLRGYAFAPEPKGVWQRTVPEADRDRELAWVDANAPGCRRKAVAVPLEVAR
jgi:hypothetical protein